MIKAWQAAIGLVLSAWVLTFPGGASAQLAPPPPPSQGLPMSPAAMMANPYMNPYMNPYLNPAATQQPMSANNALLYMYMANTAKGGIGSGRLSNPGTPARPKVAEMPYSSAVPGGGAAKFFNAGVGKGSGASRYYNQHNRYFQNNGH